MGLKQKIKARFRGLVSCYNRSEFRLMLKSNRDSKRFSTSHQLLKQLNFTIKLFRLALGVSIRRCCCKLFERKPVISPGETFQWQIGFSSM